MLYFGREFGLFDIEVRTQLFALPFELLRIHLSVFHFDLQRFRDREMLLSIVLMPLLQLTIEYLKFG